MISLKTLWHLRHEWSISRQNEFLMRISDNIYLGIRSILSFDNISNEEKLNAIKWLNEYHHRVNNLRNMPLKENRMERLINHMKFYAEQNELTKGEIAAIAQTAYNRMSNRGAGRSSDDSFLT